MEKKNLYMCNEKTPQIYKPSYSFMCILLLALLHKIALSIDVVIL